jgi:flagellar motor switch protein FliN/FliY
MATTHPLPAPAVDQLSRPETADAAEIAAEEALVPSAHSLEQMSAVPLRPPLARLPVELDVSVPVRGFRVRNLLALEPGQVIETQWAQGEDMPLAAGAVQLAWSEFEVVETELAVRITRLA